MKGHRPRTRAQLKHRNRFRCQYSMCQTVQAISVGPFVCVCRIHIHLLWFTCAAMDSLANGVAKSPTCHTVYPLEQPRAMEELWLFADRFVCFYSSKFFRWIRTRRYLIYNAYVWCVYAWVVVLFCFFCWPKSFIAIWSDLIFLTTKKWNVNNIAYTKQTLRYCPAATFASIYEPWIYGFFSLLLCHASGRSVIKWRHAFRYNYQMPADISIFSFDQWLNITNNHMTSANGTRSEHTPHQIFQLCHFLFLLFRRCCASYQRISYVFIYSFGVFCFFFRSSSMFVFILLLTMVVNCYDAKQDLFQHISPFRVCSFFMFGHCVALGHLLYEFLP